MLANVLNRKKYSQIFLAFSTIESKARSNIFLSVFYNVNYGCHVSV